MWQSEALLNGIPARLADPATGPDTLRHIALTGHKTLLASFAALDASFQALVGAMVIAGIGFLWLAHLSRRGE